MTNPQKIITTNLRLPQWQWQAMKSAAAERGMSFNEYVLFMVGDRAHKERMGYKEREGKPHDLRDLATLSTFPAKPENDFSEDDQIIYGF